MTRMYEKVCAYCGKTFEHNNTQTKYCGNECRAAVQREQNLRHRRKYLDRQATKPKAKRKPKIEKPKTLSEIAAAAREAGMTYGEYVAKYGI